MNMQTMFFLLYILTFLYASFSKGECKYISYLKVELSQNSLQLNDIHNGSALGLVYTDYLTSLSCNEFLAQLNAARLLAHLRTYVTC